MIRTYPKKALSILLALVLLMSTFAGLNLISANADDGYDIVWSYDYESAAAGEYTVDSGGRNYSSGEITRNALPTATTDKNGNPTNAMRYTQVGAANGFVTLGNDYAEKGDINKLKNPVEIEAGKNYVLTFDWRVDFETYLNPADNTGTLQDKLNADFKMGWVLLPDEATSKEEVKSNNTTILQKDPALVGVMVELAKGYSDPTDWKTIEAEICIPEGTDLSKYKYLSLFYFQGQRGCFYIDNVTLKVEAEEEVVVPGGTQGGKHEIKQDFETAAAGEFTLDSGGRNYSTGKITQNALPNATTDKNGNPTNAMRYTQVGKAVGFVQVGNDYAEKDDINKFKNPTEIEAGITYTLKFDWRVDFETYLNPADNTGTLQAELVDDFKMGWVLLPDEETSITETQSANTTILQKDPALVGVMVELAKGYSDVTDWKTVETEITIPEGTDLSKYKYLSLFFLMGKRGCFYIDNISLTWQIGTEGGTVLPAIDKFYDYNDAALGELDAAGVPWYEPWQKHSADLQAREDTTGENHGRVLWYQQCAFGLGIVNIGNPYTADALETPLKVEAGRTYNVEFDAYIFTDEGKSVHGNDFVLGVAIGKDNSATGIGQSEYDATLYSNQPLFTLPVGQSMPDGTWTKFTAEVVVPDDFSETEKNLLQLYARGGTYVNVYFDNVKVTAEEKVIGGAGGVQKYEIKHDYESAAAGEFTLDTGGRNYTTGAITQNALPNATKDNDGNATNAMRYTQISKALGFIQIGNDYSEKGDINKYKNPVELKTGITYNLAFDWRIDFETYLNPADNTGELQTKLNYDLKIGWVLLPDEATAKEEVASANTTIINKDPNLVGTLIELPAGYSDVTDWKTIETEIMIPDGTDMSKYKYLALFIMHGQRGCVYVDNVSLTWEIVTGGATIPAVDKFYDYNDAALGELDASGVPWYTPWHKHSADLQAIEDPTGENHGRVLWYQQCAFGLGIVNVGNPYTTDGLQTPFRVQAGRTYTVEFDYYVFTDEGKTVHSNDFVLGVALGQDNSSEEQVSQGNYDERVSYIEPLLTIGVGQTVEGTWGKMSAEIIVPDDFNDSKKNIIQIYARGGTYVNVYFDNVRVTAEAIVLGADYVVKFETNGGEEIDSLKGKAGQAYTLPTDVAKEGFKFLGWYSDKKLTKPATDDVFKKASITLYAKYLKYQYEQGFEEDWAKYPVVRGNWFSAGLWYNTENTTTKKDPNWTSADAAYQYNKDGVRSGASSIYIPGTAEKESYMTFLMQEPLAVGEKYTLSFWIKLEEYDKEESLMLWFNNGAWDSGMLEAPVSWDDGVERSALIYSMGAFGENTGEWVEVKVDFTANGNFAGMSVPAGTKGYIDDVRVTSKLADETYTVTAAGTGKLFEDWFAGDFFGVEGTFTPVETVPEDNTINFAELPAEGEMTGHEPEKLPADDSTDTDDEKKEPTKVKGYRDVVVTIPGSNPFMDYLWLIIAGGAVVLAGAAVLVVVLAKKRNRKNG